MKQFPITAQMVIKNEENFAYFAIQAVLPYVKKFLITDTGSTDNTLKIIKSIKSKKIFLTENKKDSIVKIRQKQLEQTKTAWFLLVDGDEIWSKKQLLKLLQLTKVLPKNKIAVVNRTRNCVGDIWHYLPEAAGQYKFFNKKGHFNIRLIRTLPYKIAGYYPWEEYQLKQIKEHPRSSRMDSPGVKWKAISINRMEKNLAFSNSWYLHTTHLNRSCLKDKIKGRRKKIIEKGILMKKNDLPEVFFKKYPQIIPNPLVKRSLTYEFKASLLTPIKTIKRLLS